MLYAKISDDIKTAMKAKDKVTLSVLRMMKTKIMTVDARGDLPEEEILKIIGTYEKNVKDALQQSIDNDRAEAAEELKAELEVVSKYLPKKLTVEETEALVTEVIAEVGATNKSEMGRVMGAVMKKGLPIDGKLVKELVDKKLS